MMFLWIPFLLLIPFAIFWMVRPGEGMGSCGAAHGGHPQASGPGSADPMEIARQRYARGEITTGEFEEIRRTIG